MAARKNNNPNKAVISRVIFMMFVWVGFILFTLSCISFDPADPPSHMVANFSDVTYHNWCGAVGAKAGSTSSIWFFPSARAKTSPRSALATRSPSGVTRF